jgi:hypothetical protein
MLRHVLFIVIPNVIMLSVIMLNVVMLSVMAPWLLLKYLFQRLFD